MLFIRIIYSNTGMYSETRLIRTPRHQVFVLWTQVSVLNGPSDWRLMLIAASIGRHSRRRLQAITMTCSKRPRK